MPRKNKTRRTTEKQKANIVHEFLEILDTIKLYHWKTHSYAQHRATDELHEKLSKSVDSFVEVLMGKSSRRIDQFHRNIRLYDFRTSGRLQEKIIEFREFLVDLNYVLDSKDTDLFSIRDDMIILINQFLYLFTLE